MSNETKWTPGPWVVCPAGDIWSENLVSLVADIYSPVEANASLIAVAPELYAMLSRARHAAGDDYSCSEDLLEEIDAVLAKARGE
jgi:hypothetical protein